MHRYHSRLCVLALAVVLGAVCVLPVGAAEPGILTMAGYYAIPLLDPHGTDSGTAINIIMAVCENLTRFKPGTSEVEPELAQSYEVSNDLMTYTFYLRRGITFTDGAPFNAQAVKTNIERVLALGKGPASRLSEIKSVEIADDYTVKLHLAAPSVSFLYNLTAKAGLHITSPKAIADHATATDPWAETWFNGHLVGTGPYTLTEWIPGDRVVLTRNESYWRGWEGKHFDIIVRREVPEYTTRRLLLQQGEADVIDFLQADDVATLGTAPGIAVVPLPTLNVVWYLPVFTSPVMTNIHVRKALSWAFPYQEAVAIAGMGSVQLRGPMPEVVAGYASGLTQYQTDLAKARTELAAAGYPNGGLKLTLADYTLDRNRQVFEVFQRNLSQIGVDVTYLAMDWGQYSPWATSPAKEGVDLFLVEHWPDYPEATNFITLYFMSTDTFVPCYPRGYSNSTINQLLSSAAGSADIARRNQFYADAQKIIVDEALGIWGYQIGDAIAMSQHIKGFVFTPANFGIYNFYDMYRD